MIDIKFSYNWNRKLDCRAFTTIRIYNSAKHYRGQGVRIVLNNQYIGEGLIYDVKLFYLHQMNEYMAWIDTGYSVQEAQNIIRRMYPKINFETQRLAMILIVKDEVKKTEQKELFQEA